MGPWGRKLKPSDFPAEFIGKPMDFERGEGLPPQFKRFIKRHFKKTRKSKG